MKHDIFLRKLSLYKVAQFASRDKAHPRRLVAGKLQWHVDKTNMSCDTTHDENGVFRREKRSVWVE
jgi:hypothetical protein